MPGKPPTCSKCDSLLEVTDTTFSVACASCDQWHLIDHSGDVPVATPFEDSGPSEGTLEPVSLESTVPQAQIDEEIGRLDQQWHRERQKYLVLGLDGGASPAGVTTSILIGALSSGLGAYFLYRAGGFDSLGVAIVVAGLGFGTFRYRKARAYQQAFQKYRRRRRASSKPIEVEEEDTYPSPINHQET